MRTVVTSVTVGITTAPRRVGYLDATLRSLEGQVPRVEIFAEPGSELPASASHLEMLVHHRAERLGNWHNWRNMAGCLLATSTTPFILTAQDDVIFSPTAVADAVSAALGAGPRLGFVSLYLAGHHELRFKPAAPGVHFWRVKSLCGAHAWLFPREALRRILAHPIAVTWSGPPNRIRTGADIAEDDLCVGTIALALDLRTGFLFPSRVQHIGECSSIANDMGLTLKRRALSVAPDDASSSPT